MVAVTQAKKCGRCDTVPIWCLAKDRPLLSLSFCYEKGRTHRLEVTTAHVLPRQMSRIAFAVTPYAGATCRNYAVVKEMEEGN